MAVGAEAFVGHVEERGVDDELVEAGLIDDDAGQGFVVIAIDVGGFAAEVLGVGDAADGGVVRRAAVAAGDDDGGSQLVTSGVEDVGDQ